MVSACEGGVGDPGEILVEPKRRRVFRAVAGWGVASCAVLQTVESVLHVAISRSGCTPPS